MSRLIVIARYWNDIEWIRASLEQIEYWKPDEAYLCEGNWDQRFESRSTDGTREFINEYIIGKDNYHIIDNIRDNKNYRINQAKQSELIMKLSNAQIGDWLLIIDCDHFYFKNDIDLVRELIANEGDSFDYLTYKVYNFFDGINRYYERMDINAAKLPYKVVKGTHWIPTNHPAINGNMYCKTSLKKKELDIYAMHYALARLPRRLDAKYKIGDRQTPLEWNGGIMMKQLKEYNNKHSEFAIKTLEWLGYNTK